MASSASSGEASRQASEDVEMKSAGDASGDEGLFGSASEGEGEAMDQDHDRSLSPNAPKSNGNHLQHSREDDEESVEEQERTVFETELAFHPIPVGDEGQVYIFVLPTFLSIEPQEFTNQSFQPPTTDHHSTTASAHFSAYHRALQTIRWRRNPHDPGEIQSNAKINFWEDGSMTLQIATYPSEQYELVKTTLAPALGSEYDPSKDSNTYVTVPHMSAGLLGVTNHVMARLNVLPNKSANDEALIRLQEGLAAAVNRGDAEGGIRFIELNEDPELEKKRVEAAEKEKLKAQKRREAAAERDRERASRVLNRGARTKGLTVGMLEDDEDGMMGPSPRKRAAGGNKRSSGGAKRRAGNDEYDSDDYGPRARTREDEYDKGDDFLADSDEEPEVYEEEENELDAEGEEDNDDVEMAEQVQDITTAGAKKDKTLAAERSPRPEPTAGSPEPAAGRGRRRRFVEDDDDDE